VWAKGKPTRAEITQVSCGGLTVSVSWWKKLPVQSVFGVVLVNGSQEGSIFSFQGSPDLASPQSITLSSLRSFPSTTYGVEISLYADSFQTLLDTVTATSASISCSL
jgi:hypothetical protein